MDPISGIGVQAGAALAGAIEIGVPGPAVADSDVVYFSNLMGPAAVAAPDAPIAASSIEKVAGTPGDAILDGMKAVGTEFREGWDQMRAALSRGSEVLTLADMLRMQMHMIQLSVQVELVGKAISRATQNIDQLAKLQ